MALLHYKAERRALESKQEYDQCSKLIKTEVARFEQERVEDFKDSLHTFLEGMISRQKEVSSPSIHLLPNYSDAYIHSLTQLITAWENYQQLLLKKVGGQANAQRPQNIA